MHDDKNYNLNVSQSCATDAGFNVFGTLEKLLYGELYKRIQISFIASLTIIVMNFYEEKSSVMRIYQ